MLSIYLKREIKGGEIMLTAYQKNAEPTPANVEKAKRNCTLSCCCTAMGDVPFTDAAIIILYANALGAGDGFTMITTSLVACILGLLSIPAAWITMRMKSYHKVILLATAFSLLMFGGIVCAPFFGRGAVSMLILFLILFSVFHTAYVSAWFPLLDTFLTHDTRSRYLGNMRFSWQLCSSVLLFLIGLFIGKSPSIGQLQWVMLFCMAIFSFKFWFIASVPNFQHREGKTMSFRLGLATALANKSLTGYSVYQFILNLAAYGTIPLVTIYLKKALHAPDNVIVFISSVTLAGMLIGSLCAGRMIQRFGIRNVFLFVHVMYALTNFSLFFLGKGVLPDNGLYIVITGLQFVYSFTFACANISSSSEMMALATPGNKVMAMAFCNSFYYAGQGLSRILTSAILGSGILAPFWVCGGRTFCHYQTIFLLYGVCILFAATLLVVVPAIFPKGKYIYAIHH